MKLLKSFSLLFLTLLVLISCQTKSRFAVDTSNIKVTFKVDRFDKIFYSATAKSLKSVQTKFPYLFPGQQPDTVWLDKIKNPDLQFLYGQVQDTFPDFKSETADLSNLFKHITYYYPKFKAPNVITLISEVDYQHKVIYADSLLLVSLDMYLGPKNVVYDAFPKYLKATFDKKYLMADVAKAIGDKTIPIPESHTFISNCIQQGKRMYQSKAFVPTLADSTLLKYSSEQMKWAQANEEFVWKYFISNNIIFNPDRNLVSRFISQAPFSKFYLEDDNKTPGRIGVYIGYQIVKSFMENNQISLVEMLRLPNDIIFKKSKYKPKTS